MLPPCQAFFQGRARRHHSPLKSSSIFMQGPLTCVGREVDRIKASLKTYPSLDAQRAAVWAIRNGAGVASVRRLGLTESKIIPSPQSAYTSSMPRQPRSLQSLLSLQLTSALLEWSGGSAAAKILQLLPHWPRAPGVVNTAEGTAALRCSFQSIGITSLRC